MPFIKIQRSAHIKRPSSAVGELCLNKLDFINVYILLPGNFHARNLPLNKNWIILAVLSLQEYSAEHRLKMQDLEGNLDILQVGVDKKD